MRTTADAVVVGGGAIGASTAFHLALLGLKKVVLCERRTLAAEATGKSAAHVQIGEAPEAQARLTLASLPYYLHWDELVGVGSCGFEQTGYLRFGPTEAREESDRRAHAARALGIEARIVDCDEVRDMAPYLDTSDITYAHFQPLAGHASATGATFGFAERAKQLGAEIREQTSVRTIDVEAGRAARVRTNSDEISTPVVVLAAGAWTPALLDHLGLVIPVTVMRTQVAIFTWPPAATPIRFMSINDYINGCYFAYDGPGARHVIVGLGESGRKSIDKLNSYDEAGDLDYAQRARERLVTRVPIATYIDSRGGWAGPITVTGDGLPIIDKHPEIDGVFFATGCNGGGFKSSPAVGRALAEWATSGAPQVVDLTPFRADRFT